VSGTGGGLGRWLVRALLVVVLAGLITLVVLVRPLEEPPASEGPGTPPTPTANTGVASVSGGGASPTPAPTEPPSPTREPSVAPTLAPSPTATPAPTEPPAATATLAPPEPTATPSLSLVGRVMDGTYHSAVTGQTESYRVYLPPGYDEVDRRYPTLYLLHGWPYDERHWDALGVDEAADAGMVAGTLPHFVIVLPGADSDGLYVTTSGGAGSFEEQVVNELMPHIDATFRTLQTRDARGIGGISRGGVWSLEIAMTHPDAFGIVGAHSPALSANRAPPAYDPFYLIQQPGVESLRVYLSAGDQDWAREATWQLHQALNQQGIPSQLAIHEGAHVDALWAANIPEYLAFYAAGW